MLSFVRSSPSKRSQMQVMGVEKVAEDTAMWDRVKGQEKMAAFLASSESKIEAVLANNDDMALGAIEALKAKGYFKDNKFLPVVGVDATAPAIQALSDGTLARNSSERCEKPRCSNNERSSSAC